MISLRPVWVVAVLVLAGVPVASAAVARAACDVRLDTSTDVVAAVDAAAPGATICFAPGTYRLSEPIRPRADQTLDGSGAVLSGARVLTGFVAATGGWRVGGQTQQGERNGTCADGSRVCTYPDDVLQDGRPLRRVLRVDQLAAGTYFFDYALNTITVHDDPAGHRMEAMVSPVPSSPGPAATA